MSVVSSVLGLDLSGSRSDGKRVLVVDDEPHIVRLIQNHLEAADYTAITASCGKEALERVTSELPDLVVLDVMMPCLDGFAVLQEIRKNGTTRDLPVIMLTSTIQDADVFRGWHSEIDQFLPKPFSPLELLKIINKLLR